MLEKYAVLVAYFGLLCLLGFIAARRVKGMKDFVTGNSHSAFGSRRFPRRLRASRPGSSWALPAWEQW